VIPRPQVEKKDALRLLGARLVEVPAVPYKNHNYGAVFRASGAALAKSEPGGASGHRFDNTQPRWPRPRQPLRRSGGRWMEDRRFVSAVGTGGTLGRRRARMRARTSRSSGARRSARRGALSYYKTGELKSEAPRSTEGSEGRVNAQPGRFHARFRVQIPDARMVRCVRSLAGGGACVGGSSGVKGGRLDLARALVPGHDRTCCATPARATSRACQRRVPEAEGLPVRRDCAREAHSERPRRTYTKTEGIPLPRRILGSVATGKPFCFRNSALNRRDW